MTIARMLVKSHLPVPWLAWILRLGPPLPLYFEDGGICVQAAAL